MPPHRDHFVTLLNDLAASGSANVPRGKSNVHQHKPRGDAACMASGRGATRTTELTYNLKFPEKGPL